MSDILPEGQTLRNIWVSLGFGLATATASLIAFGFAVKYRNPNIAPRCFARPKETIYNPTPSDPCQNRGNAFVGWIDWVLSLSYDTMLRGVPGTGTRKGGLQGRMLNVNLDGVILLRFHHLGLKVSMLTMILALFIVLPINLTAPCFTQNFELTENCDNKNLTDYQTTTLANIPQVTNYNITDMVLSVDYLRQTVWFGYPYSFVLARLYVIAFCSWISHYYTCQLLKGEWREVLALRRVFYLEQKIWEGRREELAHTLNKPGSFLWNDEENDNQRGSSEDTPDNPRISWKDSLTSDSVAAADTHKLAVNITAEKNEDKISKNLSEAVANPTKLENEQFWSSNENSESFELELSKSHSLDKRVLSSVDEEDESNEERYTTFRSLEVDSGDDSKNKPSNNTRPGLLGANFGSLRMLSPLGALSLSDIFSGLPTFQVRQIRREKLKNTSDRLKDPWVVDPEIRDTVPNIELYSVLVGNIPSVPAQRTDIEENNQTRQSELLELQLKVVSSFFDQCVPNQPGFSSSVAAVTIVPDSNDLAVAWKRWYAANAALRRLKFIRALIAEKRNELKKLAGESNHSKSNKWASAEKEQDIRSLVGNEDNMEVERAVFEALNYGPEQSAVYIYETAVSSINCCPYGCNARRIEKNADLNMLLDMEHDAVTAVYQAHQDLNFARQQATEGALKSAPLQEDSLETKSPKIQASSEKFLFSSSPRVLEQDVPARPKSEPISSKSSEDDHLNSFGRTGDVGDNKIIFSTSLNESSGRKQRKTTFRISSPLRNRKRNKTPQISTDNNLNDGGMSFDKGPRYLLDSEGRITLPPSIVSSEINIAESADGREHRRNQILRNRKAHRDITDHSEEWRQVNAIRRNQHQSGSFITLLTPDQAEVADGVLNAETLRSDIDFNLLRARYCCANMDSISRECLRKGVQMMKQSISAKSTFAVVTFTSRQSAVAARHCLADGRGENIWTAYKSLPVPPLADSAPYDCGPGCCRPTTFNMNINRRLFRRIVAFVSLGLMYIFSTFVLTSIATLVNPIKFIQLFPGGDEWLAKNGDLTVYLNRFSGLIPGLLQSVFLSLCPLIFTFIANFGSGATSLARAEGSALEYYWWFILITAFAGTSLATMVITAARSGNIQLSFTQALIEIASAIPTQQSYLWINTLIVRFAVSLPMFYLLHIDTFLLQLLGLKCCHLLNTGGMNGSIVPYRVYGDSGIVFVCTVALSFVSPLVAPFALMYFLVSIPLMRRNTIYYYRPKYDGGGFRWPFLFEMLVSSLLFSQVLLAVLFLLKQAPGPAIAAIVPFGPTLVFLHRCRTTFSKAFHDAGLLQMSLRDGWDITSRSSMTAREEYRKFLVDAHKAAYVPVCIAGDTVSVLTAEPAVVVATDDDASVSSSMD